MESVGQYLKRERELRDISLEGVSKATKISKNYIESIERDNFDVLPGRTFVIGFLRLYSNYVGLDSNDVVNRYIDYCNKKEEKENPQVAIKEEKERNPLTYVVVLVSLITAIALIYFFIRYS